MKFLRYYSNQKHNLDCITDEVVYFSSVSNFNDPMDSEFAVLTGGQAELRKSDDLEKVRSFIENKPELKIKVPDDVTKLGYSLEMILLKCTGVASFSRVHEYFDKDIPRVSPAMLSHYASNQNGFCVYFDYDEQYNKFFDVDYIDRYEHFSTREIIDNIDWTCGKLNLENLQRNPFRVKNIDWERECEYRVFHKPKSKLKFNTLGITIDKIFLGTRFFDDLYFSNEMSCCKRKFVNYLMKNDKFKTYLLFTPIEHGSMIPFRFHELPSSWDEIESRCIAPLRYRLFGN